MAPLVALDAVRLVFAVFYGQRPNFLGNFLRMGHYAKMLHAHSNHISTHVMPIPDRPVKPEFKQDTSTFRSPYLRSVRWYETRSRIVAWLFGYPCPGCMFVRLVIAYIIITLLLI